THDNGLVWDDCAANAFWAEADGTVWIGTLKGLSRFQPKRQPRPLPPPPAAITSVKFGDRAGQPEVFSEISYRDHNFFVSYAGLSFLNEKNQRFRYRLVGLDDRWTITGLREVRYSGLPAGTYRFEVAARNGSTEFGPTPA